jgi:hypothetical protein
MIECLATGFSGHLRHYAKRQHMQSSFVIPAIGGLLARFRRLKEVFSIDLPFSAEILQY